MTSADSSDRLAGTVTVDVPDQVRQAVLDRDLLDRKLLRYLEEKALEQLAEVRRTYKVALTRCRDRGEEVLRAIAARDWHDRPSGLAEIEQEQRAWTDLLAEHEAAVSEAANDLLPEQVSAQIADYREAAEGTRADLRRSEHQLLLAERIEQGPVADRALRRNRRWPAQPGHSDEGGPETGGGTGRRPADRRGGRGPDNGHGGLSWCGTPAIRSQPARPRAW